MKIVVIARTKNEERNIRRFIESYTGWVDEILIADGGSTDQTLDIIDEYSGVHVKAYTETFEAAEGVIRNPQGKHVNFLIRWAHERNADWIIFDDADCFPTKELQKNSRAMMESTDCRYVYFHRVYCYLDDQWFPDMNDAGHALWAWRAEELWADEQDPLHLAFSKIRYIPDNQILKLDFPMAGLHCTWPTEEEIQRKIKFYEACWNTEVPHPTESFGKLEKLPEWAYD